MILVTTPTGDIGARVLHRVLEVGELVRVVARRASSLPEALAGRIDVVEGSHADAAVIGRALAGVDRVFWLPPGSPDSPGPEAAYVNFSRAFARALPDSDVTHVVGVSALGRGWPKPSGHAAASVRMDDLIAASRVSYRALACASLMDNIARQAGPIRETGTFYAPTPGNLELPHVAKSDVAAVAARLLLSPDWQGAEDVALRGSEDLSFDAMATIMSEALGRSVTFRAMSMEDFAGMMRSMGTSEGMAEAYVEMLTAKNEGMDATGGPGRRADTPTRFGQWCEDELRPIVGLR